MSESEWRVSIYSIFINTIKKTFTYISLRSVLMLSSLTHSNIPRDIFFTFHCVTRAAYTSHFRLLNHPTNIGLKWEPLLLACIREALSSHLGRNIGYPERAFRSFTQSCKESARIIPTPTTISSSHSPPILR